MRCRRGSPRLSDTSFDVTDTLDLEYDADLTGIEATPFDVSTSPAMTEDTFENEVYGTRYYSLSGLEPGDEVAVTLEGLSDAILSLIDEGRSVYTDESYAIYSDAVLTFTAEADVTYWLEVLNYSEEVEPFTLSVTRTPGDAPAEETDTETAEEVEPTEPPHLQRPLAPHRPRARDAPGVERARRGEHPLHRNERRARFITIR